MQNLGHIDFEILKFISKKEPIHKDDILRKFPDKKFSTEFRMKKLLEQEYSYTGHVPIPFKNSSCIC